MFTDPTVIVRVSPDHLELITQPDHAALAAQVMAAWRRNDLPTSPRRDTILLATREHDNGWIEEDRSPIVDPATGQLLDFIDAPEPVRQRIWPRGVERLEAEPYASALVAAHALNVSARHRQFPSWDPFFEQMERMLEDALRRAAPATLDDLRHDYFFVRMGDLISLAFCNEWRELRRLGDYALRVEGNRVMIAPDPFEGAAIGLNIPARQLPNRRYSSPADADAAFATGTPVTIAGTASGTARL
jgi:hypothetical protein